MAGAVYCTGAWYWVSLASRRMDSSFCKSRLIVCLRALIIANVGHARFYLQPKDRLQRGRGAHTIVPLVVTHADSLCFRICSGSFCRIDCMNCLTGGRVSQLMENSAELQRRIVRPAACITQYIPHVSVAGRERGQSGGLQPQLSNPCTDFCGTERRRHRGLAGA